MRTVIRIVIGFTVGFTIGYFVGEPIGNRFLGFVSGITFSLAGAFLGVLAGGRLKKPWLAALLNLIPLGLGYLYVGLPDRFAANLLGGLAVLLLILGTGVAAISCGITDCPNTTERNLLILLLGALLLLPLICLFTAWDAWRLAKWEEVHCFTCGQDNPPQARAYGACGSPLGAR